MNTFKKNQIIITALAIMIAVAGYLNFTGKANIDEDKYVFNSDPNESVDTKETGSLVPNNEDIVLGDVLENDALVGLKNDIIGDISVVPDVDPNQEITTEDEGVVDDVTDDTAEETIAEQASDDIVGEAVFVSSNSVASGYFLEAKIKREQTRAYSLEILLEVINNENLGEEQKIQAAAEMIDLQDRIEKEAAAESMLEAKGFKNSFVRVDEASVDVVINAEQLSETELAQIYDVVSRKTGFEDSNIVITPLKIQN